MPGRYFPKHGLPRGPGRPVNPCLLFSPIFIWIGLENPFKRSQHRIYCGHLVIFPRIIPFQLIFPKASNFALLKLAKRIEKQSLVYLHEVIE